MSRSSPKTLQGDLRPHAREHVVEAVRDRLADVDGDRQHGEPGAKIGDDLGLGPRMLASRSTSISEECTPSACSSSSARPVRRPTALTSGTSRMRRSAIRPTRCDFGKRDARIEQHVDRERALVERRQEGARQKERGGRGGDHRDQHANHQGSRMAERPLEQRAIAALEHAHEGAVAVRSRFRPRQHVVMPSPASA